MRTFREFISEMGKLGPIRNRKTNLIDFDKQYSLRTYQGLTRYSAKPGPGYEQGRDPSGSRSNLIYGDKPAPSGPPNVVNTNMPIVGGGYENRANKPGRVIQNPGLKNRQLKWLFLPPDKGGTGLEV